MIWIDQLSHTYEPVGNDPKELGVYLVLRHDEEGFIRNAEIGLINFSTSSFTYELKFNNINDGQCSELIAKHQIHLIKGLPEDWYHGQRAFEIQAAVVNTEGMGPFQSTSLKIRNKHLVAKGQFDALVNAQMILLASYPWEKAKDPKQLKEIAKDQAQSVRKKGRIKFLSTNDPIQKANFPSVLDLHVGQLQEDTKGMTSTEILMLQLSKFDRFIDEALRLNIDRVFVIHGIGKGRLKEEIFRRLKHHPHVTHYKNEFHPKYKFGATEIELG